MSDIYLAWYDGDTEPAFYVKANSEEEAIEKIMKKYPDFKEDLKKENVYLYNLDKLSRNLEK